MPLTNSSPGPPVLPNPSASCQSNGLDSDGFLQPHRTGTPPVTIIILTWNGIDFTKRCLHTLRANTTFPNYTIVVADNGSADGTVEFLEAQKDVRTIRYETNLGFARGNNRAIAASNPESDIVLLNNDTEIHQSDWLMRLQTTAYSSPHIGIVGCRLARADGKLQHAGTYMPLDTLWGQQFGAGEKDINQFDTNRSVEGVVFACAYLKRQVLEDTGLLDEDYFSYFEDSDFCLRAAEKGYRVVCCGSVTITHHENVSTRVNRVSHAEIFTAAQSVFRSKWENKFRASRYTREIGWHSIFNFPTGYAISSRQLACALDRQGVHVAYKYVYGPATVFPKIEPETSDNYMVNVIRGRVLDSSRIQVVYAQGDVFQSNFGSYRIGMTMLETDRIPSEWVRQANQMDEVWVPSSFNARTFAESGVHRPIHLIPLGVDPDYFNPRILRRPFPSVYTFLSIFEWGERKMPELLLRAFNDEFRSDEAVVLLCKVLNVDPGVDVRRAVCELELSPSGGRIHFALNQVIPDYQLGLLYRTADCFVLTTRGEGWGMPIIEAMACGLPVIATNWSAHCDFMTPQNAYPLRVERLVRAQAKCPYYTGSCWAEPSYHDLRRLMRHVFQNQNEARAKGEQASRDVLSNWTWEHAAKKIISRIDQIRSAPGHADGVAARTTG